MYRSSKTKIVLIEVYNNNNNNNNNCNGISFCNSFFHVTELWGSVELENTGLERIYSVVFVPSP
jgi:hypothetical protein